MPTKDFELTGPNLYTVTLKFYILTFQVKSILHLLLKTSHRTKISCII